MTTLLLVLVVSLVCGVLFVVAVIRPRRSRRMQEGIDRSAERSREKVERHGGRLGDVASQGLSAMQAAADASAEKGREVSDEEAP